MLLVALAALLLALTSLLAFLGRFSWVLDNLASFRPQLTVALTVLLLLLLLGRWPKTAAIVGLVTLINLATLVPLFRAPANTDGDVDVRILSFNLLSDNENFDAVIDYIRQSEADLVVLHEASLPWEEAIADADLGYQMTITKPDNDIFGSLVLAPPGAAVESFGFRVADPRAVEVVMPVGLRVLAIHPVSPSNARRANLRNQQLALASQWVKGQEGPVVVVGDFNAGPFSYPYRRLRAETGLRDSIRGYGLENSYPASAPAILRVSIDHLLYSEGVGVIKRDLGPALGSDHFPLIVDLSL
ncbi:MAG TPA: endonuclease/exonuclease/phosphatase family protein [Acidimicrobiia bacterium]|nr:endonuclease/exonuclease/phosphatase family protein [Acidimicrobiia bacterium]